jgi:hypothetical protein
MAKSKKEKVDAVTEVFDAAPIVKKPAKKEKEKEEVELQSPFDICIAANIVKDVLKSAAESLALQFKKTALEIFHESIKENKRQPETFVASCGKASANFQFRKSGFSQEIADKLRDAGVPFEVEEKESEHFIINPEISSNQDLLKKLAEAIKNVKELNGIAVVQRVPKVEKYQFNDATFAGIVENFPENEQREIFEEISTLALSQCKLDGGGSSAESTVSEALSILSKAGILQYSSKSKK